MKVCCLSDQHGHLPKIPACDLLIISGDLCPSHNHNPYYQANWLDFEFRDWIRETSARFRVVISGNHDFVFERHPGLVSRSQHYHYLQDDYVSIEGFKVYGTPWTPFFYNWAFNLYEEDLAKKWAMIPDDTDILVTHGPPYGYGDQARRVNDQGYENVGSPSLLERIKVLPNLRLLVCGHIHPSRGIYKIPELPNLIIANAAIVNEQYKLAHEPLEFDLTPRDKR